MENEKYGRDRMFSKILQMATQRKVQRQFQRNDEDRPLPWEHKRRFLHGDRLQKHGHSLRRGVHDRRRKWPETRHSGKLHFLGLGSFSRPPELGFEDQSQTRLLVDHVFRQVRN